MRIRRNWIALTAVGAFGVGALTVPAFAQDGTPPAQDATIQEDTDDTETEEAPEDSLRARVKQRAKELFAENLGVTIDELEAAREATREQIQEEFADEFQARREERVDRMLERIDRALENGRITEEQAEELRQRIEDGELPFGRHRDGHGPAGRGFGLGHGPGGPGFGLGHGRPGSGFGLGD